MARFRIALGAVVVLIVAVVLLSVLRPPMPPSVNGDASSGAIIPVSERLPAPDFTGIDGWLNTRPLTLASLRGRVVLVDFWTFSCVNCVRTIPHLQQLNASYARDGLVIVGVHSPEFDFEKVTANVAAAVRRLGVTWPVAIDSQMATWNAYRNEYWPAEYVLDQQGHIAYTSVGEGGYADTAMAVAQLLGVRSAAGSETPPPSGTTPELYAGSERGQLADGASYGAQGQPVLYPDHGPPAQQDAIQVTGAWVDQGQYLVAVSAGHVRLRFHADAVYVVAGTVTGRALSAGVALDGGPVPAALRGPALTGSGCAVVRQDLYQLVAHESSGYHLIDLEVPAGFQLYTFTFG